MACDITLGRSEVCHDSVGGLEAIYIINKGDLGTITYDATNTDAIESVTGSPLGHKYELRSEASSFEQTIVSSRDTGTTVYEQVLNITLKDLNIASHKEIKLLVWGMPHIIVRDRNDNYFMMGLKFGANVTGGSVTTGAAMADLSGYTLTFTAREPLPANFLEATSEAGLVTAGFKILDGAGVYQS